jgi:hypothetical protein
LPEGRALTLAIEAADADFFRRFFNLCQPAGLDTAITPDFEFYHDKDGVVAMDSAGFVKLITDGCTAKQAPGAWCLAVAPRTGARHAESLAGRQMGRYRTGRAYILRAQGRRAREEGRLRDVHAALGI